MQRQVLNIVDSNELELAVAIGQLRENRRHELTQAVLETKSLDIATRVISAGDRQRAQQTVVQCAELGIEIWPLTSPSYPVLLREINSPPAALYVKRLHSAASLPSASIGVVGTRAASIEMCQCASEIAQMLAQAGLTVISGLALGIDGAAHRGALQSANTCPTVAVLAHGLERVYPPTHSGLARQILDSGGMLLSEYAPYVDPMKHHFLARNRIIAGLSRGVVVIEAGARSGSLVTANFAADYGRDVFVLSASEHDPDKRQGCQSLIEQGAIPITSAGDVLREYGLVTQQETKPIKQRWETMSVDTFIERTKISVGELLKREIAGQVVRLPGNQVRVWTDVVED
jgi:DNA processing protein